MIKIEDLFFRDHYDFGTKIGVFYLLGPTNIFDETKWPSDQKRLDAPALNLYRFFSEKDKNQTQCKGFFQNVLNDSFFIKLNTKS